MEVASALVSALSAARALLQRSPAADIGAQRVAFAAAALQVLLSSSLPPQTDAAGQFLAAVLFSSPGGSCAPAAQPDADGTGGGDGGLAVSVVTNLASTIKKLCFDKTDSAAARLQALTAAVLSIGAAAPGQPLAKDLAGDHGAIRQQCLQVNPLPPPPFSPLPLPKRFPGSHAQV